MKEGKKPIYKKWWIWLVAVVLVIGIYGVATNEERTAERNNTDEVEAAAEVEDTEEPADLSREEEIQAIIQSVLDEDLSNTEVNEIKVNVNAGLEDGSYIVLPHLTWTTKNKADTTRDMLKQYSDHLAAKLADETDISEITVFWEVPYHKENDNVAKYEYAREGDGMAIGEVWLDELIRE